MKRGTFNKENEDSKYVLYQRQGPIYITIWALLNSHVLRRQQKNSYIKDPVLCGWDQSPKRNNCRRIPFVYPQYIYWVGTDQMDDRGPIKLIFLVEASPRDCCKICLMSSIVLISRYTICEIVCVTKLLGQKLSPFHILQPNIPQSLIQPRGHIVTLHHSHQAKG